MTTRRKFLSVVDRNRCFHVARGSGPRIFEALGQFGREATTLAHRDKKSQYLLGQLALPCEFGGGQIGKVPAIDFDTVSRRSGDIVQRQAQRIQSVTIASRRQTV